MKTWVSPIYVFFKPRPIIEEEDGRRSHVFVCTAKPCKTGKGVRRYLDTKDATSTSNLRRHAEGCWGTDTVKMVRELDSVGAAREYLLGAGRLDREAPITFHFKREKGGKVSYMHRNHTKHETRTEIVKWVCESVRPFKIVKDRGFLTLMKTGRPGYYIPSPSTVSRNVKTVFARTRNRIAKMLQVCGQ